MSPNEPPFDSFTPGGLLRNAHVQTLLGSRGRKPWVQRRAAGLTAASERLLLRCRDEADRPVTLEAWCTVQEQPAPLVVLIHGWLGHAESSYTLSAATELWRAGFSVARLNLRDHGSTAELNEELYHAARIREVLDAIAQLEERYGRAGTGVVGFSLGGNFALRVNRTAGLPTVAVCPALDPDLTMRAIDTGWIGYRLFFLIKWRNALKAKQQAFPDRYDFSRALELSTVSALTDLFVREHTEFSSTRDYLASYTLTGPALAGSDATLVYSADDPVIPARTFDRLPNSLRPVAVPHGGHCSFVYGPGQPSWIDRFLVAHFAAAFGHGVERPLPPAGAPQWQAV